MKYTQAFVVRAGPFRLVPMVASGSIATPIAATFPFEQVTKAIETAIAGQGKVLLTP